MKKLLLGLFIAIAATAMVTGCAYDENYKKGSSRSGGGGHGGHSH